MKLKYYFTLGGLCYKFRNGFITSRIAYLYFCNILDTSLSTNTDDYLIWQIYGKKSLPEINKI